MEFIILYLLIIIVREILIKENIKLCIILLLVKKEKTIKFLNLKYKIKEKLEGTT